MSDLDKTYTNDDEYDFEAENLDQEFDVSENDDDVINDDDEENFMEPTELGNSLTTISNNGFPTGEFSVNHSDDTTVTVVHLDEGVEKTQVIDLASPPLSHDEALSLTNNIRTQANVLYLLIARAHAGKAHVALGYSSFENYIKEEFNYSKSYAYKLINQAHVIEAIEQVMPEGAKVYVSEHTARGLKASLNEFIPELEERVRDTPSDEAGEVVEEFVKEYRDRKEQERLENEDEDDNEYEGGERPSGNGGGNGDFEYELDDEDEEEGYDDAFGDEDPSVVRRRLEAVYNLYSSLGQFAQMPPNDEIIQVIPTERRPQVTAYLESAITWLHEFQKDWKEATEGEDSEDDDDTFLDEDLEEE